MLSSEISEKILLTKINNGESIELNQKNVQIRKNNKGLMALSYVAPIFETMDLEDFFNTIDFSGKLTMNIGGTGDIGLCYRGLVEGNGKNFSKNIGHVIILFEDYYISKPGEYINAKRVSKFMPRDKFS